MAKKRSRNKPRARRSYRSASRDFSKKSIGRAATASALKHWTFQYSLALLAGAAIFGAIVGLSEAVFWMGIGALAASCLSFTWKRYFREDAFEKQYVDAMRREIECETQQKRKQLAGDLAKVGCPDGVAQLKQLQADFDSLAELLQTKLDTSEITYQRYLGMAEEVFLSGIDNLMKVLTALMSISEIDEDQIAARLARLEKETQSPERGSEMNALRSRLEIRKRALDKVRRLLAENEMAITKLEETALLIADMDTGLDEGKVDMENSMKDLMRIVERARKTIQVREQTQS